MPDNVIIHPLKVPAACKANAENVASIPLTAKDAPLALVTVVANCRILDWSIAGAGKKRVLTFVPSAKVTKLALVEYVKSAAPVDTPPPLPEIATPAESETPAG